MTSVIVHNNVERVTMTILFTHGKTVYTHPLKPADVQNTFLGEIFWRNPSVRT